MFQGGFVVDANKKLKGLCKEKYKSQTNGKETMVECIVRRLRIQTCGLAALK